MSATMGGPSFAVPSRLPRRRSLRVILGWVCPLVAIGVGTLAVMVRPAVAIPALVGLVLVGAVVFEPFVGILLMFFLGLIGNLQYFGSGESLVKATFVLVSVSLLARMAVTRRRPARTGLILALGLFLVAYSVGLYRSLRFADILSGPVTTLGYVAGFAVVLWAVRRLRHLLAIAATMALAAILSSLVALLQWLRLPTSFMSFLGGRISSAAYQAGPSVWRTTGLAHDPNAACYPLILAIPFLLGATFGVRRGRVRLVFILVVVLASVALVTTGSRSGLLGGIVSVAGVLFMLGTRRRVVVLAVVGIAFLAIAGMGFSASLDVRLSHTYREFESDRRIQYLTAFRLLGEHPVFGAGYGAFEEAMQDEVGQPLIPHSNLLDVITASGMVGLLFFVVFAFLYVRFVVKGLRALARSPLRVYAVGALSALAGLQAQGLFISNMGWSLMWLTAAIPVACIFIEREALANRVALHLASPAGAP